MLTELANSDSRDNTLYSYILSFHIALHNARDDAGEQSQSEVTDQQSTSQSSQAANASAASTPTITSTLSPSPPGDGDTISTTAYSSEPTLDRDTSSTTTPADYTPPAATPTSSSYTSSPTLASTETASPPSYASSSDSPPLSGGTLPSSSSYSTDTQSTTVITYSQPTVTSYAQDGSTGSSVISSSVSYTSSGKSTSSAPSSYSLTDSDTSSATITKLESHTATPVPPPSAASLTGTTTLLSSTISSPSLSENAIGPPETSATTLTSLSSVSTGISDDSSPIATTPATILTTPVPPVPPVPTATSLELPTFSPKPTVEGGVNIASVKSSITVSPCQGSGCSPIASASIHFSNEIVNAAPNPSSTSTTALGGSGGSSGGSKGGSGITSGSDGGSDGDSGSGGGSSGGNGVSGKHNHLVTVILPILAIVAAMLLLGSLYHRRRKQKRQKQLLHEMEQGGHNDKSADDDLDAYTAPPMMRARSMPVVGVPVTSPPSSMRKPIPVFEENSGLVNEDRSPATTLQWRVADRRSSELDIEEMRRRWEEEEAGLNREIVQARESPFWDPSDSDGQSTSMRSSMFSSNSSGSGRQSSYLPTLPEVIRETEDCDTQDAMAAKALRPSSFYRQGTILLTGLPHSSNRNSVLSHASSNDEGIISSLASTSRSSTSLAFAPPSEYSHTTRIGGYYTPESQISNPALPSSNRPFRDDGSYIEAPNSSAAWSIFATENASFISHRLGALNNPGWLATSQRPSPRFTSGSGWPINPADRYR